MGKRRKTVEEDENAGKRMENGENEEILGLVEELAWIKAVQKTFIQMKSLGWENSAPGVRILSPMT